MFPEGDGVSEQEVKQRSKEEKRRGGGGGEEGMVHLVWTRHLDRAGMGRERGVCRGSGNKTTGRVEVAVLLLVVSTHPPTVQRFRC